MLDRAEKLNALDAPSTLKGVDGLAKKMAREIEQAVEVLRVGFEERSESKLEQGKKQIGNAITYSVNMGDAIDRVCGE